MACVGGYNSMKSVLILLFTLLTLAMSQSSLLTKNSITFPHRQTPVEHHREYNPNPAPVFENEEHAYRWNMLTNDGAMLKPMVSSLALHDATLNRLGMQAWIYDLFRRSSLNVDTIFGLPAYKELVYEFLSTLEVHDADGFHGDYSGWEFKLNNQPFYWSRKDACKALGFPEWGLCSLATEEQRIRFWCGITGQQSVGEAPNHYSILSPTWRYVHRLIATGINCNPETMDIVSKDDLNILWALDMSEPINWFDVFSDRFRAMQSNYTRIPYVGCTSVITLIAEICNFRFSNCLPEYKELDMGMIKKLRINAKMPDVQELSDKDEDPSEEEPEEEPLEYSPRKGKNKMEANTTKIKTSKKAGIGSKWIKVRKVIIKEFYDPVEGSIEIESD